MSRFGPDPAAHFDAMYQDLAPWDVGDIQPDMAALLAAFPPAAPVLDVGCGSGDTAIAIARHGVAVTGIDLAPKAIAMARAKVTRLPPELAQRLTFEVGDALRPSGLGRRFGAVVDSGFGHLFDTKDRDAFIDDLARVLGPGGRYYLLAFAVEFPVPHTPRAIIDAEVRHRFTRERGWNILTLQSGGFLNRVAEPVPATAACIERAGAGT